MPFLSGILSWPEFPNTAFGPNSAFSSMNNPSKVETSLNWSFCQVPRIGLERFHCSSRIKECVCTEDCLISETFALFVWNDCLVNLVWLLDDLFNDKKEKKYVHVLEKNWWLFWLMFQTCNLYCMCCNYISGVIHWTVWQT